MNARERHRVCDKVILCLADNLPLGLQRIPLAEEDLLVSTRVHDRAKQNDSPLGVVLIMTEARRKLAGSLRTYIG